MHAIINLFNEKVKNKPICLKPNVNRRHNGAEGHWLEDQMGICHNNKCGPDINGVGLRCGSLPSELCTT